MEFWVCYGDGFYDFALEEAKKYIPPVISAKFFIMLSGGEIMDKANVIKRFLRAFFGWVDCPAVPAVRGPPTRESTGEYIDASVLTSKVKTAIYNDPMLKVLQINVETFKDVVQLSGFVDSPEAAARAVEVARSVEGVRTVKNKMSVK